jgi:hypothetical protein
MSSRLRPGIQRGRVCDRRHDDVASHLRFGSVGLGLRPTNGGGTEDGAEGHRTLPTPVAKRRVRARGLQTAADGRRQTGGTPVQLGRERTGRMRGAGTDQPAMDGQGVRGRWERVTTGGHDTSTLLSAGSSWPSNNSGFRDVFCRVLDLTRLSLFDIFSAVL